MDIVTHAITGAATGLAFGHPALGAIVAVLPDTVLGVTRRSAPNTAYNVTHAPFPMCIALAVGFAPFGLAGCAIAAYISHIVLDLPTHGGRWAPKLFAPFSYRRISIGDDWEYYNGPWWVGAIIATLWSALCLSLAL